MKQPSGLPVPADVIAQGKGKTVLVTIPALPPHQKNENIYHELTVILMNRLLLEV